MVTGRVFFSFFKYGVKVLIVAAVQSSGRVSGGKIVCAMKAQEMEAHEEGKGAEEGRTVVSGLLR